MKQLLGNFTETVCRACEGRGADGTARHLDSKLPASLRRCPESDGKVTGALEAKELSWELTWVGTERSHWFLLSSFWVETKKQE